VVREWSADDLRALTKEEVERLIPDNLEELSLPQLSALSEHPSWAEWVSPEQKQLLRVLERMLAAEAAHETAEARVEKETAARKEAEARARVTKPIWEWCSAPDPVAEALISTSSSSSSSSRKRGVKVEGGMNDAKKAAKSSANSEQSKSAREAPADSTSTTPVPMVYAPQFVKRWDDFAVKDYLEKDGKVYMKSIDGDLGYPRTEWKHRVDLESSINYLIAQMWHHVTLMANSCFPLEDDRRFDADTGVQCVDPKSGKRVAALVFQTTGDSLFSTLLVGEVKTTSALDTTVMETVTEPEHEFVPKRDPRFNFTMVKCALIQLCIYLTLFGGLQYGFVTSYEKTYFCKLVRKSRDNRMQSGVQISKPFFNTSDEWVGSTDKEKKTARMKNSCNWTLSLRPFCASRNSPFGIGLQQVDLRATEGMRPCIMETGVCRSEILGRAYCEDGSKAARQENRLATWVHPEVDAEEGEDEAIDVVVSYRPGNVRTVLGGEGLGFMHQIIAGKDCFVKVTRYEEAETFVRREASVCLELKHLWGVAMPSLICQGDTSIGYAIVVTNEGESLQSHAGRLILQQKPKEVVRLAESALKAIHSSGWLHGDIAARNIGVSATGVRFVDFESAKRMPTDNPGVAQARELNEMLTEIQGLLEREAQTTHAASVPCSSRFAAIPRALYQANLKQ